MSYVPGHHLKSDVPSGHDVLIAKLQAAWRLRCFLRHVEADPLPLDERTVVSVRLRVKLLHAQWWLAQLKERQRQSSKVAVRSGLRVLSGGRR